MISPNRLPAGSVPNAAPKATASNTALMIVLKLHGPTRSISRPAKVAKFAVLTLAMVIPVPISARVQPNSCWSGSMNRPIARVWKPATEKLSPATKGGCHQARGSAAALVPVWVKSSP